MLGNSASYEVGKSYTPLFQEWERHLSHQGRLDELFLLFSDSKKAGEDHLVLIKFDGEELFLYPLNGSLHASTSLVKKVID